MLGSRFDLAEAVVEIALRDAGAAAAREKILGDHCAELEQEMAEVARQLHGAHPRTGLRCPICDTRMRLKGGVAAGLSVAEFECHDLECDTCGLVTERIFDAVSGYQEALR